MDTIYRGEDFVKKYEQRKKLISNGDILCRYMWYKYVAVN